jgi:hypothetical protein
MPSRRAFVAGTCLGLTTLVAGCADQSDADDSAQDPTDSSGDGDTTPTESTPVGESETATDNTPKTDESFAFGEYTDWIPASLSPSDDRTVGIQILRPAVLVDIDDIDTGGSDDALAPGVDATAIRLSVSFSIEGEEIENRLQILRGDFEAEAVREGYAEQTGIEETGTYRGFDIYTAGSERAVAVRDAVVVTASDRPALDASLDAHDGSATRLVDDDEDVGRLTAEVGTPDYGVVSPDVSEFGATGLGSGYSLSEGVSSAEFVLAYEDAQAASNNRQDVADGIARGRLSDRDVTVDGRLIRVTGIQETRTIFSFSSSDPRPPSASLTAEYDDDTGRVTLTNEGPSAIPADELALYGSGFDDAYRAALAEMPDSGFGPDDAFGEGENVSIPLDSESARLVFLWEASDGSTSTILLVFEPDE